LLDKELQELERSHKELTVLAQEYLKELGSCDHSVNICTCVEQAKLRFAHQVRAGIDGVPWCVVCDADKGHTSEDCPYQMGSEEGE